eukprot:591713-Prorocentrum_minimum.AAC.1
MVSAREGAISSVWYAPLRIYSFSVVFLPRMRSSPASGSNSTASTSTHSRTLMRSVSFPPAGEFSGIFRKAFGEVLGTFQEDFGRFRDLGGFKANFRQFEENVRI